MNKSETDRMPAPKQKVCPRCGGPFECNVTEGITCWCHQQKIAQATRDFLQNSFYVDCLCSGCLAEIDTMIALKGHHPFPRKREQLVEGLHYYMDNGYWVFTELYHLLRGYCCGNHCRHCAYGNMQARAGE